VSAALRAPHAGFFDPASIEPGPIELAGVAVDLPLMKRLLSGLMPGGAAGMLSYPAQNRGVRTLVAALPRALRDHMMDRYLGAIQWSQACHTLRSRSAYLTTMAIAGFAPGEIELTQNDSALVTGQKGGQPNGAMLHQGIAFRSFKQSFNPR
jgi:hypothetical protein